MSDGNIEREAQMAELASDAEVLFAVDPLLAEEANHRSISFLMMGRVQRDVSFLFQACSFAKMTDEIVIDEQTIGRRVTLVDPSRSELSRDRNGISVHSKKSYLDAVFRGGVFQGYVIDMEAYGKGTYEIDPNGKISKVTEDGTKRCGPIAKGIFLGQLRRHHPW